MLEINFFDFFESFNKSLKNGLFVKNLFKNFKEYFNKNKIYKDDSNYPIIIDNVRWTISNIYGYNEADGSGYDTGEVIKMWRIFYFFDNYTQYDYIDFIPDGHKYIINSSNNNVKQIIIENFKRYLTTI